jgi:hypothetical protein
MARLVAIRQKLREHAEVSLKRAQLDAQSTEALLAEPWAAIDTTRPAGAWAGAQDVRDVGYARLQVQQAEVVEKQAELLARFRDCRQVELLLEKARAEVAAVAAKREARTVDDWLRRQKRKTW